MPASQCPPFTLPRRTLPRRTLPQVEVVENGIVIHPKYCLGAYLLWNSHAVSATPVIPPGSAPQRGGGDGVARPRGQVEMLESCERVIPTPAPVLADGRQHADATSSRVAALPLLHPLLLRRLQG